MTVLSQRAWEDALIADWVAEQEQLKRGRKERRGASNRPFLGDISELEELPESKYKNDTFDGRIGEVAFIERLNLEGFNVPIEEWHKHEPGKKYDQKDIVVNDHRIEVKYIRNDRYPFGDTPDSFVGSQLLVAKVASINKHVHPPLAYGFVHASTGGMLVLPFTDEVTSRFYERLMWSDDKQVPGYYLKHPQQYLQPFSWLVNELKEKQ